MSTPMNGDRIPVMRPVRDVRGRLVQGPAGTRKQLVPRKAYQIASDCALESPPCSRLLPFTTCTLATSSSDGATDGTADTPAQS